MALTAGTHSLGPGDGKLELHTFREGVAQKVGHDLIFDVTGWSGTAIVGDDGSLSSVGLEVDSRSLQVREGHNGIKPLTDKDRTDIVKNIDDKVLLGQPITFRSDQVETTGGLTVRGALTIVGTERPASFELTLGQDGRVNGQLSLTQTEFGIKPYKALMGALKVRDEIKVVLDVQLPAG